MREGFDVVVIGGANSDYLIKGSALPRGGETIDGTQFDHAPGGKGANQAVAAARLGARTAFIGMVGLDDRGEQLVRAAQREGVDTSWLMRSADAPTGAALVMVDDQGQKQIMTAPGANRRLGAAEVRRAAALIRAAKVVLMQLETTIEAVVEAATIARDAGAAIVLDPAPPSTSGTLPDELLAMITLLKPNAHEAEALVGTKVHDVNSARDAAKRLMDKGVGAVVVQAGSGGNLAVWRGGERYMPNLPVESVDATGAGDAFAAALAVMLAEGRDIEQTARFGHAAAALATTKLGAQAGLPTRAAVEALLK